MTRREMIAELVELDGRIQFNPFPKYRALGFVPQDLGPVGSADAKAKGDEMFKRCRLAKRADKHARILAKAARIQTLGLDAA